MLINCVAYERGVRLRDLAVDEIPRQLAVPGSFVWVALRDPEEVELARMQEIFGLHDLAVEDARHGHQRPKIEEYGDTLFAAMHLLEYKNCGSGDCEVVVGEVAVFAGPDFVLSVRSRSEHGFLGVRARAEREPELLALGPGYVFYALMDAVVDRYFPVIDALEVELEQIEEAIFARNGDAGARDGGSDRDLVERLYALKRKATVVRHAVLPLLDAVGKLWGGRVPPVVQRLGDYFRDVHDHLLRVAGALDALRDTIATGVQVNLALVAIEQTEVSKRLSAWAAIFAAVTALAGVWGMNFEHMPELNERWGYPAALAAMVGVAIWLHRRFRKAGWL